MIHLLKTIRKITTQQKLISFSLKPRRYHVDNHSYVLNLFNGKIEPSSIFPFPNIKIDDKIHELLTPIVDFFKSSFDPSQNDSKARITKSDLQTMQDLGLFRLLIPKEYGGLGLTVLENSKILEVVGSFDLSISYGILMHELGCTAVSKFGNKEQKETYLPRAAKGELISFCLGEPSVNSIHPFLNTRANLYDDDYYILNGHKVWVPFGSHANIFVVFATTTDGFPRSTAFMLERSSDGITVGATGHKIGVRSITTSKMYFKNVKVHKKNILGEDGSGTLVAMRSLGHVRASLAAAMSGNMKKVIEITSKFIVKMHIDQRVYKGIQDNLTDMTSFHYAIESIAYLISCNKDEDWKSVPLEAVICKCVATNFAFNTCDMGMAILGGDGLLNEVTLERSLRDIRVFRCFAIDNDILRIFIAKQGIQFAKVNKSPINMENKPKSMNLFTDPTITKPQHIVLPSQNFQEIVHPELISVSNFIARAIKIVALAIQHIITTYSYEIIDEQLMMTNIGDVICDIYSSTVVLSRATHSLNENLPTASYEKLLTEIFCVHAFRRILHKINIINWEEHYKQFYNVPDIYKEICKNRGVIHKSLFD